MGILRMILAFLEGVHSQSGRSGRRERVMLRRQLIVVHRSVPRLKFCRTDRVVLCWLSRLWFDEVRIVVGKPPMPPAQVAAGPRRFRGRNLPPRLRGAMISPGGIDEAGLRTLGKDWNASTSSSSGGMTGFQPWVCHALDQFIAELATGLHQERGGPMARSQTLQRQYLVGCWVVAELL